MKKEILRINNLTYQDNMGRRLEHVSLHIMQGEIIGLFGLSYSGKDLLVQLLDGTEEGGIRTGASVFLEGVRVTGWKNLQKSIYRIAASNYIIDEWTVAEYMGLVGSGWLYSLRGTVSLEKKAAECLKSLGIAMDVSRKMSRLSEREKRIVDLAKAYKNNAKVVIIEDEFEGMSLPEIRLFAETMKQVIAGRMSVIVSSHSIESVLFLSDRLVIFHKGQIIKKCPRGYIRDTEHLAQFMMNDVRAPSKVESCRREEQPDRREDVIYSVRRKTKESGSEDFYFVRGEIVTFLALDRKKKEQIFRILSGHSRNERVIYRMGSRYYDNEAARMPAKEKIVAVRYLGSQEEIFAQMSVRENLILPTLKKITSIEYISSAEKIFRMLENDLTEARMDQKARATELGVNDLIRMTLERWYLYNPKVLVLYEPFALCDIEGVSIVKSYIEKFALRGTAVIIVKTREEYIEDISDHIIHLD